MQQLVHIYLIFSILKVDKQDKSPAGTITTVSSEAGKQVGEGRAARETV